MKTQKGYVQGYNAQAAVTEDQIITAAEVTQQENDKRQLHPMLDRTEENAAAAGVEEKVGAALADAGYWSESNAAAAGPDGPELLIATTKDHKQRKLLREAPVPRGRTPKDLSCRERMERKLLTKRGRALYKLRGRTVEPVFGQIKDARGCGPGRALRGTGQAPGRHVGTTAARPRKPTRTSPARHRSPAPRPRRSPPPRIRWVGV